MATLWEELCDLADRRAKKRRRYPLPPILGIAIAAMLSGANDLRAIFRWARRLSPAGLASLGISRGKAPCHATYHYVFRDLTAAELDQLLCDHVRADRAVGHVAIDGKRLRGSRDGEQPGLHLLVAWCKELRASLGNFVVPPDSGSLPEAISVLKNLPLHGATLTMDAAFTNRQMLEVIREAGAAYFLMVKDNQPGLKAELAHAFGDTSPPAVVSWQPGQSRTAPDPADLSRAETVEKGHGRIETRRIAVRTALPRRLDQSWPGLTAICRIERLCETGTQCSGDVVYAITSLSADRRSADTLLGLSRGH